MNPDYDEVVISGIGGRFPGSSSIAEFKEKLFSKTKFIQPDVNRWNPAESEAPFFSSKLIDNKKFDASFFGMNPKLTNQCDPMMGLLLESSFEALFDAGVCGLFVSEKNISVISTVSFSDSELLRMYDGMFMEGLGMVGHARTMLANRISYCFNFKGPSYNYDSSWTSNLEGLEKAVSLVGSGEVDGVLVVTSNVLFYDSIDEEYKRIGFISDDGEVMPFDDKGTGFVRSEAVVAVYVQRADEARRNYASIVHIRAQCMGNRATKYVGVDPQLNKFFKKFYDDCKVDPASVAYVETGVIGHKEFDVEELNAVADVFCKENNSSVLIGSIKGNIGNADCASGFVSLVKLIFALESGMIPPTVNYSEPNSLVKALSNGQLKPVTEVTPLKGDFVAVNSVNFSGSVAHLLLKRNSKTAVSEYSNKVPKLLALQARNEEGAKHIIEKLCSLRVTLESAVLINDAFRSNFSSYLCRAYTIAPASETTSDECIKVFDPVKRPLWYVFSGMGSQWAEMGRDLLQLPLFAAAVDKSDKVLAPYNIDIKGIITTKDSSVFDDVINCFVGLATIQVGLIDILNAIGVIPDGIVGHSVGEIGCAYADGCLTAEEAILASYFRGLASRESEDCWGLMAAVGIGQSDVRPLLMPSIDVACHNSSTSCTLSGPTDDVNQIVTMLKEKGIFAKAVSAAGIAYHSRYIKPIGTKLLGYMKKFFTNPKPRSAKWISSSAPQALWDTQDAQLASAEYFTNNLLSPVLFEEACKHIPENAILVEIGAHGLLQAILKRSMSPENINIPLTNRSAKCNLTHVLNAIGRMYVNGVNVDVSAMYPKMEFPVPRETFSLDALVTWDHQTEYYKDLLSNINGVLNRNCSEKTEDINENLEKNKLWKEHCIDENIVIPISEMIMYPCKMVMRSKRVELTNTCIEVEDFLISDQIYTSESEGKRLLVSFAPVSFDFEISLTSDSLHCTNVVKGRLSEVTPPPPFTLPVSEDVLEEVTKEQVYSVLAQYGLNLGPQFQTIEQIRITNSGCYAQLKWTNEIVVFLNSLLNIVVFLQSDIHYKLMMPVRFKRLLLNAVSMKMLQIGEVIEVFYDKRSSRVVCGPAEFCGLKMKPVTKRILPPLSWQEETFYPYFSNATNIEEFLLITSQLAEQVGLKMWSDKIPRVKLVFVKPSRESSRSSSILCTESFKTQLNAHFKCIEVEGDKVKDLLKTQKREVFVLSGQFSDLEHIVDSAPELANVYCISSIESCKPTNFAPVIVPENTGKLAALKKVIRSEIINIFTMESCDSERLQGLRLLSRESVNQPIVVVTKKLTPRHLLPILAAESFAHLLRTVFIIDDAAPQFSAASSFYAKQLSLGLPVNILKGGKWVTLRTIKAEITPQKKILLHSVKKSSEDKFGVHFFGLNTTYLSRNQNWEISEFELSYLDYSGSTEKDRVMGLALYNPATNSLAIDQSLKWSVPREWTLEDAATVPTIYSLVFYSLVVRADIQPGEVVLVHCGMSSLGQAAIRVALSFGATVIATVEDAMEANTLSALFPSIKLIFELKKEEGYLNILKVTSGKGVDIVLNCLTGKHIELGKEMLKVNGRFLHLGEIRIEDKDYIGMKQFVIGCAFFSINLRSLSLCNDEDKSVIKKAIQNGIEQGSVKPLPRKQFYSHQQIEAIENLKILAIKEKTLINIKEDNVPSKSQLTSDLYNGVTIVAGSKTELWLDVLGWLMDQGVSRLVVLTSETNMTDIHKRRLNKLIDRHQGQVDLHAMSLIESYNQTQNFFNNIKNIGSITNIFCVGMDENSVEMKNLDIVSREAVPSLSLFVSLLSRGAAVSESREMNGLPIYWIHSDSLTNKPALLLPYMSFLLDNRDTNDRFFIVKHKQESLMITDGSEMQTFLPTSVEQLSQVGRSLSQSIKFHEVATQSPGIAELRQNILPVFLISGLGHRLLRPFLGNLINPACCNSLPAWVDSTEEYAKTLFNAISEFQKDGPFNIVGESLGASPALALSRLLVSAGHKVQLFLIEPTTVENIAALCDQYQCALGPSLLAETLRLQPQVVKEMGNNKTWENQLIVALDAAEVKGRQRHLVARALSSFYSQLLALKQQETTSYQLPGKVKVVTCKPYTSTDVYNKMFQETASINITGDEDLTSLLANRKTAKIINDNMVHDWTIKHKVDWQYS